MKVYKVSDYTKPAAPTLTPTILFELTKKLMKYITPFNTNETKEFIKLLRDLKSLDPQSADIHDWIDSRLSQYLCLYCKKEPFTYCTSSVKICENCIKNLKNQKKCINCKRKYGSQEFFSICSHFCIYCCPYLFLRQSIQTCQICNESLVKIKTLISQCDNPAPENHEIGEPMQLYEKCVSILVCGHNFCGDCSKIVLKKGICLDTRCKHLLTAPQKNLLTHQISSKCFKCKKTKLHSDLEISECCNKKFCSNCLNSDLQCPVCDYHVNK